MLNCQNPDLPAQHVLLSPLLFCSIGGTMKSSILCMPNCDENRGRVMVSARATYGLTNSLTY